MYRTLIALFGLVLMAAAPALANTSWEDESYRTALRAMDSRAVPSTPGAALHLTGRVARPSAFRPATTEPAVLVTFITAGVTNPGVACLACVPQAMNPQMTAGISSPLSYVGASVPHLDYILFYQDYSFNGPCAESLVVTAGTTTLFKAVANFSLVANSSSLIGTGQTRPVYTGKAMLVGKIACPGTAATVTKTELYFE